MVSYVFFKLLNYNIQHNDLGGKTKGEVDHELT